MPGEVTALTYESLAFQAASAQARYDWQADIAALAGRMDRFLASGLFVPACVGPDGRAAVACAPREDGCAAPAGDGPAAAFAAGVYFPRALAAREPVPVLGPPAVPDGRIGQPLRPGEGCAVGFVDLAAHLSREDGRPAVDWARLGRTVHKAVFFLDCCLDVAAYPDDAAARATRAARKLALGAFGLADVLAALGLAYDSDAGRALAVRLFAALTAQARAASRNLAAERRPFPLFSESRLAGGAPVRNALVTGLAPSGPWARAAGRAPGIEPLPGDDVPDEARLRMQAAVERQVDGTAAVPLAADSPERVQRLCAAAWRMGCTMVRLAALEPAWPEDAWAGEEPLPAPAAQTPGGAAPAPEAPEEAPEAAPAGAQQAPLRFCPVCGRAVQPGPAGPVCPVCGTLHPLSPQGRPADTASKLETNFYGQNSTPDNES